MQTTFTFSAEQEHWLLVAAQYIVWPARLRFGGRALAKSRDILHEIITENVNRARDELKEYLNDRFAEHEQCDQRLWDGVRRELKLPPR